MQRRPVYGGLLALILASCSSDAMSSASFGAPDGAARSPGAEAPSGNAAGTSQPAPPEKEVESQFEAPVATGNYVWIANPTSGRVAFVDATTLQVRTVEAGNGPTYLAKVPAQASDTTLVLNVLSQDATLLVATKDAITTKMFKTAARANALAFSADGRFAIAWVDSTKIQNAPQTEGFQDLAVLDLTDGSSTILAVGYRPVTVGFAEGAPRAYAVTQDGVSIIDLTARRLWRNVAISDNPSEDPGTRDVFVTKSGDLAFVRRDDSPVITAVSLDTGVRTPITLSGPVTDLDLTDKGDKAVAVVRSTSEVAVLPIPGIVQNPTTFTSVTVTGQVVGSVSLAPGGARAMLYTNATPVERLTILELGASSAFRTVRLYAPVLGVFSAPDAANAVVLHDTSTLPSAPSAFSLVPLAQDLPAKIVAMQASPTAVAVTADRAVVAEKNGSTFAAYVGRMPELMVDRYPLASPPTAVGVVETARRAYVAQDHPEGRLTFIDLDSGVARTLTGFELSSRVVDGSTP